MEIYFFLTMMYISYYVEWLHQDERRIMMNVSGHISRWSLKPPGPLLGLKYPVLLYERYIPRGSVWWAITKLCNAWLYYTYIRILSACGISIVGNNVNNSEIELPLWTMHMLQLTLHKSIIVITIIALFFFFF